MMSFKASFVLLFFALTLVSSSATESPDELYWKSKLGSIKMPKIIKASLQLGSNKGGAELKSEKEILQDVKLNYYFINYVHVNPIPQDGRVEFFTNEKLDIGTKIKLHFNKIDNGTKFLPYHITKSMNITFDKLQDIFDVLSMTPKSPAAKYIENMVKECDFNGIEDEVRYCAPSLQAMVEVVTSNSSLNNTKLMLASTEEEHNTLMEYRIQKAEKLGNDDRHNFVCHKLNNPFAVFLCHNIRNTDIYGVSLVGTNGKQMNAVAVCHKDTSKWYPGHISFKLLNLKPGGVPICHFLSGDVVVWLQN